MALDITTYTNLGYSTVNQGFLNRMLSDGTTPGSDWLTTELERKLEVKFTVTSDFTKTYEGAGHAIIPIEAWQSSPEIVVKVFRIGTTEAKTTLTLGDHYTIKHFREDANLPIWAIDLVYIPNHYTSYMQADVSYPIEPVNTLNYNFEVTGTFGFSGIPTDLERAIFDLIERMSLTHLANISSLGAGSVKSEGSGGENERLNTGYQDGGDNAKLRKYFSNPLDHPDIQGVMNYYKNKKDTVKLI